MVHATEARVLLPAHKISDTLEMINSTGLAATLQKFPPPRYMGSQQMALQITSRISRRDVRIVLHCVYGP
jgi:hypothetical protein